MGEMGGEDYRDDTLTIKGDGGYSLGGGLLVAFQGVREWNWKNVVN